ncbi:MAG: hypothetical protein ACYS8K_09925 [Planctomycetota bacterium]|jgi:hypothetical protein
MPAGLPGTGIGGTFYLVMVALMPARELWATLRRRSNLRRWRCVVRSFALGLGICGGLYVEWRIFRVAFLWMAAHSSPGSLMHRAGQIGTMAVAPMLALTPLLILVSIVFGLGLLRLAFPLRPRARPPQGASVPAVEGTCPEPQLQAASGHAGGTGAQDAAA